MEPTTTVLYHGNCPDGYAAAFACWKQLGLAAVYTPVFYGQPCPAIPTDHTIMIVDFSYPAQTLLELLAARVSLSTSREPSITVLDHHKSAQEDLAALQAMDLRGLCIVFDEDECGASLTWKYLHAGEGQAPEADPRAALEDRMPTFYKYVRDRDLWHWRLPDSKAISLAYWAIEKDFDSIELFAQGLDEAEGRQRIITQGMAMQRYADRLVEEQARRAFTGELGGYRVPIVNTTTLFSEVGDALVGTRPEVPFCAYYFDRTATQRQWGLRGHGAVDCSAIARQYGGGGHHDAAGFVTAVGWLPPGVH